MENINEYLNIKDNKNFFQLPELFNSIFIDDCINVMRRIPDETIDCCVTDPPYGISFARDKIGIERAGRLDGYVSRIVEGDTIDEYKIVMKDFFKELFRIMKKNTISYIFCGSFRPMVIKDESGNRTAFWTPGDILERSVSEGFEPIGFIIWDKVNVSLGAVYRSRSELILVISKGNYKKSKNYQKIKSKNNYVRLAENDITIVKNILDEESEKRVHVTQKPSLLYELFILDSTKNNDIVIDPFAGSGTIISACKRTGRIYIAIEKMRDFEKILKEREKDIYMTLPYKEEDENNQFSLFSCGEDEGNDEQNY